LQIVRTRWISVSTVSDIVRTRNVCIDMAGAPLRERILFKTASDSQAQRFARSNCKFQSRLQRRQRSHNSFELYAFSVVKSLVRLASARIAPFFKRQPILPIDVALLTTRHDIHLRGFATANDWHQMIHRQLSGRELPTAMVTDSSAALALPPLRRAQLARLAPFAANLLLGNFNEKGNRLHWLLITVPSFERLEIKAKPQCNQEIHNATPGRPRVAET
jgi:hypothetical protein